MSWYLLSRSESLLEHVDRYYNLLVTNYCTITYQGALNGLRCPNSVPLSREHGVFLFNTHHEQLLQEWDQMVESCCPSGSQLPPAILPTSLHRHECEDPLQPHSVLR